MTDLENIHRHIEKLVIQLPEIAALVARYQGIYRNDDRTSVSLLQTLAEHDSFFVGLEVDDFKKALETYKMPLVK